MKNRHLWTLICAIAMSVPVVAQNSVGELMKDDFLQAVDSVVQAVMEEEADSLNLLIPVKIDSILTDTVPKKKKKPIPKLSKLLSQYCVLKLSTDTSGKEKIDTVSMLYERYIGVLNYLNDPMTPERYISVDPNYYRLFLPYTYYYSPMARLSKLDRKFVVPSDSLSDLTRQMLPFDRKPFTIIQRVNEVVDKMLLASYLTCPRYIVLTEDEVMQSRPFRDNINKEVSNRPSLTKLIKRKHIEFDEEAEVIIHKPNWWITSGSGSLQFTQNSISKNWYKGGESSNSVMVNLSLNAKYNDQQRVEWENLLEIKTNISSAPSDTCHNFLVTNDLLRLYSKLGIKAVSKWYYTISTEFKTQMFHSYESNSYDMKASFFAPLDWSTSIGMDYKLSKSKINLSVFLAPLTYTMRYVGNSKVNETSYGLEEGKSVKHDFGSQVQTNFQWTIIPAVKLKTRLDYLTSYKWTRVEWETNVDFVFTSFLSAKFYVLARYDDGNAPTVGSSYFQATETLGFGLNYSW